MVLDHILVALDITLTLADHAPQALVLQVRSVSEAMEAIRGFAKVAVAFLGFGPEEKGVSDLVNAVTSRGGRVVLVGTNAEEAPLHPGWPVLIGPFSTADLLAQLDSFSAPEACPEAVRQRAMG